MLLAHFSYLHLIWASLSAVQVDLSTMPLTHSSFVDFVCASFNTAYFTFAPLHASLTAWFVNHWFLHSSNFAGVSIDGFDSHLSGGAFHIKAICEADVVNGKWQTQKLFYSNLFIECAWATSVEEEERKALDIVYHNIKAQFSSTSRSITLEGSSLRIRCSSTYHDRHWRSHWSSVVKILTQQSLFLKLSIYFLLACDGESPI